MLVCEPSELENINFDIVLFEETFRVIVGLEPELGGRETWGGRIEWVDIV